MSTQPIQTEKPVVIKKEWPTTSKPLKVSMFAVINSKTIKTLSVVKKK